LSFDYTASELALARGKPEEALQFAQNAAKAFPLSFSGTVATVNAELRLGRTNEAISLLRAKTKSQPNETIWWELLARAYDQDKKIGLRHYALAEKFATEGAWPSAIEQLKIARSEAGNDFYLGSVIDARLRVFQNQYREEQKEQKKS
jgi:predicted Zn-dependent protease